MLLRCHKPSDSAGNSSVGHMSGEINTPAESEPGPSRQGTSIHSDRPNKQPGGGDGEITHDTEIHLGILFDDKNKGDFIQLFSSVKVCWTIQHSNCLSMHCSFTPFLTRRCWIAAWENQKSRRTLFASTCAPRLRSRLITQWALWDFILIRSCTCVTINCKISTLRLL